MTNVKWLDSIEAIDYRFDGYQMRAYSYIHEHDEKVTIEKRVKHLKVRALMTPPGFPDFFMRSRMLEEAPSVKLDGRAWAGPIPIKSVEVSVDGGHSWRAAQLGKPLGKYAWTSWTFDWTGVTPGKYTICCRATDAKGRTQVGLTSPSTLNSRTLSPTSGSSWRIQLLCHGSDPVPHRGRSGDEQEGTGGSSQTSARRPRARLAPLESLKEEREKQNKRIRTGPPFI